MSYVTTVLNELTLAAMPAMNAASRPVMAIPSTPLGSSCSISNGMVLLYCIAPAPPRPWTSCDAISPGTMITNGISSFGHDAMIGVNRAAFMLLADSARCTSAKFVVQYPNDCTKPRPNTMASQLPYGLLALPTAVPCHALSAPPPSLECSTWSTRPLQPP